jgi:alpha-beta hydrolase superfamily lysophospholipase
MHTSAGIVYFAHGKESGPDGSKIRVLSDIALARGFQVESLDYRGMEDPDARVDKLLSRATEDPHETLVLVGSSMGAYVSTVASTALRPAGLFLLAPALYLHGYANQDPAPGAGLTAVVHGWHDEVVPVDNAIRFARRHAAALHLLDGDHRLMDVLSHVGALFRDFLGRV